MVSKGSLVHGVSRDLAWLVTSRQLTLLQASSCLQRQMSQASIGQTSMGMNAKLL